MPKNRYHSVAGNVKFFWMLFVIARETKQFWALEWDYFVLRHSKLLSAQLLAMTLHLKSLQKWQGSLQAPPEEWAEGILDSFLADAWVHIFWRMDLQESHPEFLLWYAMGPVASNSGCVYRQDKHHHDYCAKFCGGPDVFSDPFCF